MAGTLCSRCSQLIKDLLDLNFNKERWSTERHEEKRSLLGRSNVSYGHWGHNGTWYTAQHSSVEALCRSSVSGCQLCRLVVKGFNLPTDSNDHIALRKFEAPVWFEAQMKPLTTESSFDIFNRDASMAFLRFELFNLQGPPLIPGIRICKTSPENTGSEAAFTLATRWLNNCVNGHPMCARPTAMLLPTRVIEVEPEGGSGLPRLVVTAQKVMRGQYVALSHCWGDVGDRKRIVTTTENFEHFCTEGLPLDNLPKTFQDAIKVTKRLGFRYLWIDSFCIIQGSKEDWAIEAGRMSQVYENAVFCISALHAQDSFAGLFLNGHTAPDTGYPTMTYIDMAKETHEIGIRPKAKKFAEQITEGILSTRAWVAQERLLSTAILHYGQDNLAWECRTCFATDTCPAVSSVSHPIMKGMQLVEDASQNSLEYGGWGLLWCEVVKEYTRRRLTYDMDKLAAILGSANLFRGALDDTFLAGLWRQDLHRGLLWHRPHYLPGDVVIPLENPDTEFQVAPSWSWASIKGEITYDCLGEYPLVYRLPSDGEAQIVNAHVRSWEIGTPCYGSIEVFGQFARAYYRPQRGVWADPGSGYVQLRPFRSSRFSPKIRGKRSIVMSQKTQQTLRRRYWQLQGRGAHPLVNFRMSNLSSRNRKGSDPGTRIPHLRSGIPTFPSTESLMAQRANGLLALSADMDFDWERERECYVLRIATWAAADDAGNPYGTHTHFLLLDRVAGFEEHDKRSKTHHRRKRGITHSLDVGTFKRIGYGLDQETSADIFFGPDSERLVVLQ